MSSSCRGDRFLLHFCNNIASYYCRHFCNIISYHYYFCYKIFGMLAITSSAFALKKPLVVLCRIYVPFGSMHLTSVHRIFGGPGSPSERKVMIRQPRRRQSSLGPWPLSHSAWVLPSSPTPPHPHITTTVAIRSSDCPSFPQLLP